MVSTSTYRAEQQHHKFGGKVSPSSTMLSDSSQLMWCIHFGRTSGEPYQGRPSLPSTAMTAPSGEWYTPSRVIWSAPAPSTHTWAHRYDTWLLIELMPEGVVFSFLFPFFPFFFFNINTGVLLYQSVEEQANLMTQRAGIAGLKAVW